MFDVDNTFIVIITNNGNTTVVKTINPPFVTVSKFLIVLIISNFSSLVRYKYITSYNIFNTL